MEVRTTQECSARTGVSAYFGRLVGHSKLRWGRGRDLRNVLAQSENTEPQKVTTQEPVHSITLHMLRCCGAGLEPPGAETLLLLLLLLLVLGLKLGLVLLLLLLHFELLLLLLRLPHLIAGLPLQLAYAWHHPLRPSRRHPRLKGLLLLRKRRHLAHGEAVALFEERAQLVDVLQVPYRVMQAQNPLAMIHSQAAEHARATRRLAQSHVLASRMNESLARAAWIHNSLSQHA